MGEKKKKKKKSQLPFRLNILFIFVFVLFSLLILQLGVVQILNGEEAQKQIDKTENTQATISVPRGLMYDRYGTLILDNVPQRSIVYTPPKNGDSVLKRLEIAEKLAEFIMMEEKMDDLEKLVRERDKKEYWYLFNATEAAARLTEEEKDLDNGGQYQAMLDKIKPNDYNEFNWEDPKLLNIVAIKKELDAAYQLSPHTIKNENVTELEYALVSEHLYELPGIDALPDWNRVSKVGNTLSTFIGNITSSDQGIPRDKSDYYLTRGYSRNDRVGISGLEEEYESVLRGQKEVVEYTTDNNGNIVGSETIIEGKSGNDLVLTVDIKLQQEIDKIVQEELESFISQNPSENKHMEDALVVMMDPQTGDVLSLSGAHYDREDNEYVDQSYRTIIDAHLPGSTIKGATVLAGLDSGVVRPGEEIYDTPIKIAGTREKSSWRNMGYVNDLEAIEKSSNVYMFNVAIRLATATYRYEEPLYNFDWDSFQVLRNYYNQFGLGVETGIDLPYEATGLVGDPGPRGQGLLLNLAIGQYDTYTTLQLAQYVSTIANEGYRVRPHLVKEIRQSNAKDSLGPVLESFDTDVLNRVVMDDSYIDRVQEGFKRVVSSGTASGHWRDNKYKVAAKTGTAQNIFYDNGKEIYTYNLALVGYAPYDEPEVAFAIMIPRAGTGNDQNGIHHAIGNRIINKYFQLKEERQQTGITENLNEEVADQENQEG
ncbi:hypothetical protein GCM10011351_17040 [Paraliobacillus quinghaiensis]|uniref:serine-type D-Ala-D-Ala carboxypeptidase n=1 Tax=Paraliobacillus quinghaiensis TaxID=470815 RepID=A0A917TPN5_9BACI|nr:penicillin-binding protein 2 [Paraliobacillus quinghaiensis]GGM31485.1 hypothetical protein GCM10011351_17040 [Paraliobacillus quinghaiensis]